LNPEAIEGRAGESVYVTYDFHQPVHGYPFINLSEAPEGTIIDFGYAENPYLQYSGARPVRVDGCIDPEAVVGKGYADRYITRSGAQHYEVPDERTARWLALHIHFQRDGRLAFKNRGIVQSQYPVRQPGSFHAGDPRLDPILFT
jgi:hypothetical protein